MKTLIVIPLLLLAIAAGWIAGSENLAARHAAAILEAGRADEALQLYHRLLADDLQFVSRHRLEIEREHAALAAAREHVLRRRFVEAIGALALIQNAPQSGAEEPAVELAVRLPDAHARAVEELLAQNDPDGALRQIEAARIRYENTETVARFKRLEWRARLASARKLVLTGDLDAVIRVCAFAAPEVPLPLRSDADELITGLIGAQARRLEEARDYAALHTYLIDAMNHLDRGAPHLVPQVVGLMDGVSTRLWGARFRRATAQMDIVAVRSAPGSAVGELELANRTRHPIRVGMRGWESSEISVGPGETATIRLPRGRYLQRVEGPDYSAHIGVVELGGGLFAQAFDPEPRPERREAPSRSRANRGGRIKS